MFQASKYTFLNRKKKANKPKPSNSDDKPSALRNDFIVDEEEANEIDTNVISIQFKGMKEAEQNLQMGDPIFCKECQSSIAHNTKLYTKDQYKLAFHTEQKETIKDEKEEEKEAGVNKNAKNAALELDDIKNDQKVWICEFCGCHALIDVEPEELPSGDDVVYILKSANQLKSHTTSDSDYSVIFCVDNSGSMSVTQEVEGQHELKHGVSQEEYEMLKQFIEYGADQYLPGQKKNTTYISRKQCVLAAIESQVIEMQKTHPERKVGIVTFNDEVCVIGDGNGNPEIIVGDKLFKQDVIMQIGKSVYGQLMTKTVKDSAQKLIEKFNKLEEKGKTALGPALVTSIALAAEGKKGSQVILCTDGLANIGLGQMDGDSSTLTKAEQFYNQMASFAKENGISISIISIKGEGCKLDLLGKLADETSGSVTRVDPKDITNDFANILKNEVLGTNTNIKLRLHRAFKFRNENEKDLSASASLCVKNVGNVTKATELTFEYANRADEECMELGVDIENLKSVPFQAQVEYINPKGDRMLRIINQKQQITEKLEQAEKEANFNILALRGIQQQAQFAQKGDVLGYQQHNARWGSYMDQQEQVQSSNQNAQNAFANFKSKHKKMEKAVTNRVNRAQKSSMPPNFNANAYQQQQQGMNMQQQQAQYSFGSMPQQTSVQKKGPPPMKPSSSKQSTGFFGGMQQQKKEEKIEIKHEEEEVEDDEDVEYELFHNAKNMNSEF